MVTAALLTGSTRGAVATVAVYGVGATKLLNIGFVAAGPGPVQIGQVRYGVWHGGVDDSVGESVVVSRNDDRRVASVVHESWELHCHGGAAAADRILEDLQRLGAATATASSWMVQACSSDRIGEIVGDHLDPGFLIAEVSEVLAQAVSVRAAAIALDQIRGGLKQWSVQAWQRLFDSGLCHSGVEEGFPEVIDLAGQAKQILRYAALGLHLSAAWRVVLAGPPNVGKSSLINALVGYRRSITIDMPGTTRDVLEAQTVIDGWPVRISDTAGIRADAACLLETAGIELARRELQMADLILWVEDASENLYPADQQVAKDFGPPFQTEPSKPWIRVSNKIDRIDSLQSAAGGTESDCLTTTGAGIRLSLVQHVQTSAINGTGIDMLRESISRALVSQVPPSGAPVPVTSRQVKWLERLSDARTTEAAKVALKGLIAGD
jgi:tRNA modification GTPase